MDNIEKLNISTKIEELVKVNEEIPKEVTFNKVKEKTGPFKWFKHKVSGAEMNSHIETLQLQFAEQNRRDILTFEELKKIYAEISLLDKDYLDKLIMSAEEIKVIKDMVDDNKEENYKLSRKIEEVVKAQGIIIDKFSSFDNVLLLEEKCRNQEKEIELLNQIKTEQESFIAKQSAIMKKRMIAAYIAYGVIGVGLIACFLLNIFKII